MKKTINTEEIQPVDFSKGIRGKHYAATEKGFSVKIHREDGSTTTQRYLPARDAIILDEDVKSYFPDAQSVNTALRGLIKLLPHAKKRARTI